MAKTEGIYGHNNLTKNQSIVFALSLFSLFIYSNFIFGIQVIYVALVSYFTMFIVEYLFQKIRNKELGYSILYLPMIFTLLLPPTIPLWIVFVGAFFISFFGKGIFGGDNSYVIHPVVAGILFITISFPTFLGSNWIDPVTDTIVTTTPMVAFNGGTLSLGITDLLFGFSVGAIGETARLTILILGIILIAIKLIDYKVVVTYLLGTMILTWLLTDPGTRDFSTFYNAILVGNVLFVAIFIATDRPTIPQLTRGRIIYGIGLALITVLIRIFSAFPEGALFAIIIMNAVSPLLDQGGDLVE